MDEIASAFNQMSGAIQESTDSLVHRAFHDPLTGLPNRALFLSGFTRALNLPQRDNRVAVLFLDVDRFKYLNDTLGHGVGDQLLSVFSQRLVGAAEGQLVARLGGDEFTVLVQSTNAQATALRISERILHSLLRPFSLSGHEMFVSSSIGIAVSTQADRTSTDLLRKGGHRALPGEGRRRARGTSCSRRNWTRSPRSSSTSDNALRRSVERRTFAALPADRGPALGGYRGDGGAAAAGTTRTAASSRRPRSFRLPKRPERSCGSGSG
ncbi:MAG: GGDEF domain-containing protein [Dehalococcoidia bacterium]|nr:GGDEF domain-containing protein [Dehalococcoidia bacterium]